MRASEFTEEGPFLVTGTDFVRGGICWDSCYHVSEERYKEAAYIHLQDGDVLITKDGTIGKVAIVEGCPPQAVLNSGIFLLRCKDGSYNHRFMYYLLNSHLFEKFLADNLAGSTINHLYQHVFERFEFPIPEIEYQEKIASVLSSIDKAIAGTEALIAKRKRIKAGLMQDLLTRGIDEHGNARSEATHTFKDSPLGRIPVGWEVVRLSALLASYNNAMRSGPFGSALLKEELVSSGIPLLGIDNVFVERFVRNYTRFVKKKKARELGRYQVRPGDVMITIMGTVGRSCVVPDDVGLALSSKHVWTITIDSDRCSSAFLSTQLNYSAWVLRHFSSTGQGGIMSAISSETLRTTPLVLPGRDEIRRIDSALQKMNKTLRISERKLEKLRRQRNALMQDILSGEVPVDLLLDSKEDTA